MRSTLKFILKIFIITLLILVIALVAAPFFIRQEQIKNFIQNKVSLSSGSKLAIEGDINFGIFPYSFVSIPKAIITDKKGAVTSIDNLKFGFNPASLLKKSVTFDISLKLDPVEYAGHIEFKDYHNFIDNGESAVEINLEKPVTVNATAYFERKGDKVSLLNIKATHKQTQLVGSFQSIFSGNSQNINITGTIDTQNLDDLRKLYKLNDAEKDFSLFSGIGKVDFNVSTSGIKSEDFISNLNGKGSINLSQATIYGLDLGEIIGAPQAVKMEKNYDKKIEINKADATFTITNGIAVTQDLNITSSFANAQAKGQADLSKQILAANIDVNANLAAAQVNIPLTVSGSFGDLKVSTRGSDAILNNLNALKNASKIQLNNVKINLDKDSLENIKDIGKGLGMNLKSLLKNKGNAPADSAPAPAPEPTQ